MTTIEFLNQYREADRRVRRLAAEYAKEREMIDAVRSSSDIDGLPHGNGINKPVEDRAVRLADKAAEWKIAQLEALHVRQEIFGKIIEIGGGEADVLIERYIELKTWKDVCSSVNWSWPKVRDLHRSGLEKVSRIIK